jgi:muramoyltetrapeptide carboxypeptidase
MLTQLAQGEKLKHAAGVAFGYCTDCPIGEGPSFSLEELLHEHLGGLGVPAVAGVAFGHIQKMLTLPIGLEATLDADAGTLTFAQSAVV